ncbi:MAG TPA: GNAT family N-acetyltransferase [Mycobacteriales bacterium]|nr:GNAT family N-acetyltransferase [Mycobacteriales bacterium]
MDELTWRPATLADVPALTRLQNLLLEHDGFTDRPEEQNVRDELSLAGWDITRNTLLAQTADGELAGAGLLYLPPAGGQFLHSTGGVAPQWRGRGIGRRLVSWYGERAAEAHRAAAPNQSWELHLGAVDSDESSARLYARMDLKPVRYWFEMERPVADPVPEVPVADGLRLVPYAPSYDRALHTAHTEAFRDHWGSQPRPFDEWYSYAIGGAAFRPQQTFLAVEAGGAVGGYLLSFAMGGTDRMWMGTIGVRRPWRRQGVASALMARALQAYREAGVVTAALDVDSANPSGAVGVYERMGFRSVMRTVTYAKTIGG